VFYIRYWFSASNFMIQTHRYDSNIKSICSFHGNGRQWIWKDSIRVGAKRKSHGQVRHSSFRSNKCIILLAGSQVLLACSSGKVIIRKKTFVCSAAEIWGKDWWVLIFWSIFSKKDKLEWQLILRTPQQRGNFDQQLRPFSPDWSVNNVLQRILKQI
jgi:hypothetical protein